ncbi:hypothetical protein [Pseudooceanicola sp. 200-1SW]|uniref:hypothetical protein n=1 Tax=Pseudooceanicola sp. 200-1SW TaxID=3425949 RepID=UPI003D7F864D
MTQVIHLPRPYSPPAAHVSPARLPLKVGVAIAFVAVIVLLSAVVPQQEVAPDMAWRGNSASLEMIR